METKHIAQRFNSIAKKYDEQRKCYIPHLEEYYSIGIRLLAGSRSFKRILDLGAGTGLLSQFLLGYFPKASYTLVDVSGEMLQVARQRFAGADRFTYAVEDYSRVLPKGKYDLIVSALSIHHLPDADKMKLYRKIHASLSASGWFLNVDQYRAEMPLLERMYNAQWLEYIRQSGLPEAEIEKGKLRRKLDRETTVPGELKMLKKAGFREQGCVYRHLKFGVVLAKK
jgi:tRNA (cmo5U34)-methyltransferase